MLVRLMYASRAAESVNAEELAAILKQSKEHNAAHRRHRRAVLLLQRRRLPAGARGRPRRGQRALQPHRAGPAPHDVVLLSYEEIGERRFAGWSMGQVNMAG